MKRPGASAPDCRPMTPAEYGRWLADQDPPITVEQAEAAARILLAAAHHRRRVDAAAVAPRAGGRK